MDRDGGRAGPQRVQGDAGDVAHEIDPGAADAVVKTARVEDRLRQAEAGSRRQAPQVGAAPRLFVGPAVRENQGQRLANLFAQADAEREAEEAEQKVAARIVRRPVREADHPEDVEHDPDDAGREDDDGLRPLRQGLHDKQEQQSDGGGEHPHEKQVLRLGRSLKGQGQQEEEKQQGGAARKQPMAPRVARKPGADQLVIRQGGEDFFQGAFVVLLFRKDLLDAPESPPAPVRWSRSAVAANPAPRAFAAATPPGESRITPGANAGAAAKAADRWWSAAAGRERPARGRVFAGPTGRSCGAAVRPRPPGRRRLPAAPAAPIRWVQVPHPPATARRRCRRPNRSPASCRRPGRGPFGRQGRPSP